MEKADLGIGPRRLLSPLFWVGLALYAFVLQPLIAAAQEQVPDLIAPKILHARPLGTFRAGQEVEIAAAVTDQESGVAAVRLFFRSKGEENFIGTEMARGDRDQFRGRIPGDYVRSPGVEYYIEAEDRAGNRVRTLRPPDLFPSFVAVETPSLWERFKAEEQPWYKRPWVWTLAGVVAVGAVAAIAGGGGGGGGGGQPAPTTGTVTVTGPVP
ncbi:MAG: hypothetical protein HY282_03240 [Nitrospirae bacterium]|nr:hypothetical protein [Candidatus Manganitrophaceae bacterium]